MNNLLYLLIYRDDPVAKKTKKRISNEILKLVINSLDSNLLSIKTASETFNIPYSTVANMYKRYLETGRNTRKKQTKFRSKTLDSTKN